MATTKQIEEFNDIILDAVQINKVALDYSLGWIRDNLDPDDVFDEKSLSAWAESNGYTKE